MKRSQRPLAGLALLGAASVAVVAAATVWLYTGWTTIGLTLTDRIGDSAQALQGFTLEGEAGWTRSYDSLHFRLEDGILHTGFVLDDQYQTDLYTITDTQTMVLPPETRQAVDREAVVTRTDANGVQYVGAATRFLRRMYTLRFPDGTAIRLAGEDVALEQEAILYASTNDSHGTSKASDYYWNGDTANERDAAQFNDPRSPCYPDIVPLGGDYGVCWRQTQAGYRPGLYRAHGLTGAEIAALPRDGTVQGTEVLCASTEFGALTPFYCPADAKTALAGAAMEGGFTLLLYLDGEDTLWADLVTAGGPVRRHPDAPHRHPGGRDLGPLQPGGGRGRLYRQRRRAGRPAGGKRPVHRGPDAGKRRVRRRCRRAERGRGRGADRPEGEQRL